MKIVELLLLTVIAVSELATDSSSTNIQREVVEDENEKMEKGDFVPQKNSSGIIYEHNMTEEDIFLDVQKEEHKNNDDAPEAKYFGSLRFNEFAEDGAPFVSSIREEVKQHDTHTHEWNGTIHSRDQDERRLHDCFLSQYAVRNTVIVPRTERMTSVRASCYGDDVATTSGYTLRNSCSDDIVIGWGTESRGVGWATMRGSPPTDTPLHECDRAPRLTVVVSCLRIGCFGSRRSLSTYSISYKDVWGGSRRERRLEDRRTWSTAVVDCDDGWINAGTGMHAWQNMQKVDSLGDVANIPSRNRSVVHLMAASSRVARGDAPRLLVVARCLQFPQRGRRALRGTVDRELGSCRTSTTYVTSTWRMRRGAGRVIHTKSVSCPRGKKAIAWGFYGESISGSALFALAGHDELLSAMVDETGEAYFKVKTGIDPFGTPLTVTAAVYCLGLVC